MRNIAFVPARMGSRRLPGKALMKLAGKPALERLIEILKGCFKLHDIVILTTVLEMDDPIELLANSCGIRVIRGSVHDVLDRFRIGALETKPDRIVRVNGDASLSDPEVIDYIISEHEKKQCEYTTNQIERTYPRGLDTEVIEYHALEKTWRATHDRDVHEHVTIFIRDNPELFNIQNIKAKKEHTRPNLRLCLDTMEDYRVLSNIYDNLYNGTILSLSEVIMYLDQHPEIAAINSAVEQTKIRGKIY